MPANSLSKVYATPGFVCVENKRSQKRNQTGNQHMWVSLVFLLLCWALDRFCFRFRYPPGNGRAPSETVYMGFVWNEFVWNE
jgi:hypothetical protein